MKGVILAGGLATRLRPLTLVTNKHLLPIYHQPMIFYPLQAMQQAGIKEVLLTTSGDHAGHFANLLKAGEDFDLKLYYAIQENSKGGIADAISLAQEFAGNEPILVLLGDNIFHFKSIHGILKTFHVEGIFVNPDRRAQCRGIHGIMNFTLHGQGYLFKTGFDKIPGKHLRLPPLFQVKIPSGNQRIEVPPPDAKIKFLLP